MRALSPAAEEEPVVDEGVRRRSIAATAQGLALAGAITAALGMAMLVLTTDPTAQRERMFASLTLLLVSCLASFAILLLGARNPSSLGGVLRAFRRGILCGLACSGAVVLQFNAALTPANFAFLLLLLLIVEMIFLARRQSSP